MTPAGAAEELCSGAVVAVRALGGFVHGWGMQQHLWVAHEDGVPAVEASAHMGSTAGDAIQVEDRSRHLLEETGRVGELRPGYRHARSADSVAAVAEYIEQSQIQAVEVGRECLDDVE